MTDITPSSARNVVTTSINRTILSAQDDVSVEYLSNGLDRDCLAICFYPIPLHGVAEFVVDEAYLLKSGYDIIAIHGANTADRYDKAASIIQSILFEFDAYSKIIALGVGDGANAALHICGPLDWIHVLAFSPTLPDDNIYTKGQISVSNSKAFIDARSNRNLGKPSLIFDRFTGIDIVKLNFSSTPTWFAAIETGVLRAELGSHATLTAAAIQRTYRCGRNKSSLYLLNLGVEALALRKYMFAARALKAAFEIDPNPHVATLYGRSIAEGGAPNAGIKILDLALKHSPDNAHLIAMQAYFSELGHDDTHALHYIRKAIAILPDHIDFVLYEHRLLGRMYDDLVLRYGMTAMILKKKEAELALEGGEQPNENYSKMLVVYAAMSVAVVVMIVLVSRYIGII